MVIAKDIKQYLSKKGFKVFDEGPVAGTEKSIEITHYDNATGRQKLENKPISDHYCEAWYCGPPYTEKIKRKYKEKCIERWQLIFVYKRDLEDISDQDAKTVISMSRGYSGLNVPDRTLLEERLEGTEIELKWKDFINRTPIEYIEIGYIDDILDEKYKDEVIDET